MASPFKHPAATLPGELDLLAAVTDDLAADVPKLVYADWLQEHGDPRGDYLRRAVQAVGQGERGPRAENFSPDWLELTGVTLTRRVRKMGAEYARPGLLHLAEPALVVDAQRMRERLIRVGESKLDGQPSLPKRTAWPRCGRGPMRFLGQINLGDFAGTVTGRRLPPEGLLSFFMYHDHSENRWGTEDGTYDDGACVIWSERTSNLARRKPPADLTGQLGWAPSPSRMTFSEVLDLPEPGRPAYSGLGLSEEFTPRRVLSSSAVSTDCKLFGFPHYRRGVSSAVPGAGWTPLIQFPAGWKSRGIWGAEWYDVGSEYLFCWYIKTEQTWADGPREVQVIRG